MSRILLVQKDITQWHMGLVTKKLFGDRLVKIGEELGRFEHDRDDLHIERV